MFRTSVSNAEFMFNFALPHDHPATGAEFPLHSDVVDNSEDRGKQWRENLGADIHNVSLTELVDYLTRVEGRVNTWVALKPGKDRHFIQVFFSKYDRQQPMSDSVKETVARLLGETWGWGQGFRIHNEKALDLVNIGLVVPMGTTRPEHSFVVNEGFVEIKDLGSDRPKGPIRKAEKVRRNVR